MRHLITGATSGIGKIVAERLRDRGDELVLVVREPARAADFPDAELVVADLADPLALDELTIEGDLDSVVHAAGVVDLGPVAEPTAATSVEQLTVNTIAPALLTRASLPALRRAQGTAVFVNSGAGIPGEPPVVGVRRVEVRPACPGDSLREEEPELRVTTVFRAHGDADAGAHPRARGQGVRRQQVDPARDRGRGDHPRHRPARDAAIPEIVIRPGR